MKIVKDNTKIVCDIKGCNEIAAYKLVLDVGGSECLRLCEGCLRKFYNAACKSLNEVNTDGKQQKKSKKSQ
ncbi:MAG: hypothetical protein IJW13_00865 [Clostridia bacterium]|nr:hypothetical protein [Clostridia bacterium]